MKANDVSDLNDRIAGLELSQIEWVVPDIHAAVKLLSELAYSGFDN